MCPLRKSWAMMSDDELYALYNKLMEIIEEQCEDAEIATELIALKKYCHSRGVETE